MANIDGLVQAYGKECMLTGVKVYLSYHHIIKKEYGGDKSLENGGLLYTGIHAWIHNELERKNKPLYYKANNDIKEYKAYYNLYYGDPAFKLYKEELQMYYLEQMMDYYYDRKEDKVKRLIRREYEKRL